MRVFSITPSGQGVSETDCLPAQLPAQGFVWIACARREFEVMQAQIQATLQLLCGTQLVDLHICWRSASRRTAPVKPAPPAPLTFQCGS